MTYLSITLQFVVVSIGALFLASNGLDMAPKNAELVLKSYYAILVLVGIVSGMLSLSYSYAGLMMLLVAICAIENNQEVWIGNAHVLTLIYFGCIFVVLFFETSDGLPTSKGIALLLAAKFVISASYQELYQSSYLFHTSLNAVSIALWVFFINAALDHRDIRTGFQRKKRGNTWIRLMRTISPALSSAMNARLRGMM